MIFFAALASLVMASCDSNSEMKSEIKKAIASQVNEGDKDVTVKVTKFGEFYAVFWNTETDGNKVKEKLGEKEADRDVNRAFSVVSGTKEHTGDVQHMRDVAIGLDKDIKECGVNPICYYTTCNVTYENKVYKRRTEIVYGATVTFWDGKTEVDVTPDYSSSKTTDL